MGQTAISAPASAEPRRWIPAIVGGVLLGEALWGFLHILVRDWAVPAITNAIGQGPTQNQAAFEPLPLLLAFVETCVAGILLVVLMAWSRRGSRVVVRQAEPVAATPVVAGSRVVETSAIPPQISEREPFVAPVPPTPQAAPLPVPVAAPPKAPAAQPVPSKSKKPKVVYYNSVGEPIESDE